MPVYTNHFETLKEARLRLSNTVVLYDGKPYRVLAIDDHKSDGIFRMYLDDLLHPEGCALRRVPMPLDPYEGSVGEAMDKFLDEKGDIGVIRKMMNSPLFQKFRPFPLGMVNTGGSVVYSERQPTRSTFQGLTQQMINTSAVTIIPRPLSRVRDTVSLDGKALAQTIIGNYPSPEECLKALTDPRVGNEGAAFHRMFAILRGPLDMLFVAYKGDVIGLLPNHDLSCITIGAQYRHCKEAVTELGIFGEIKIR